MNLISLQNVDLYYPSVAFKERSLKSLLAGVVVRKKSKGVEIHDIHALREVTVEIRAGERVGLLGQNGAGKSTFLKVVAGLYPISGGRRIVQGRIRALFDLSLGFEPDATGRENILYRGLLLGHTPKFIRSIEQGIIEFADLGEFIDYPIKTYSAGMQVRLAFAISVSVGGEILLLDEVMGAGDNKFMAKARARILELVEQSEILVLASHDASTLQQICGRGLVFAAGKVVFDGEMKLAIRYYRQSIGLPA